MAIFLNKMDGEEEKKKREKKREQNSKILGIQQKFRLPGTFFKRGRRKETTRKRIDERVGQIRKKSHNSDAINSNRS